MFVLFSTVCGECSQYHMHFVVLFMVFQYGFGSTPCVLGANIASHGPFIVAGLQEPRAAAYWMKR